MPAFSIRCRRASSTPATPRSPNTASSATPPFFAWLEANWRAVAAGWPEREHAIAVSCRAKAATVAADERDEGARALLNLGHTFGHALEAATGYSDRLVHGEAVAIGMVLAFQFSAQLGPLLPPMTAPASPPTSPRSACRPQSATSPASASDAKRLMELIAQDKKVSRGRLTFILTRGIGQAFVAHDVAPSDVLAFLEEKVAG